MPSYRSYRKSDLETLVRIDRECFEPGVAYSRAQLRFYIEHPEAASCVAEGPEGIVGFVVGRVDRERVAHVVTLDVVESSRRQGVGRRLLETLQDDFASRCAVGVVLEVAVANVEAVEFYRRLNYEKNCRLQDYYGDGKDAWEMVRLLEDASTVSGLEDA
jgi:[ribosomal protein S18]-alanine N-acetyltransferase